MHIMHGELFVSKEELFHFNCSLCKKWWSISDPKEIIEGRTWYCHRSKKKQKIFQIDNILIIIIFQMKNYILVLC